MSHPAGEQQRMRRHRLVLGGRLVDHLKAVAAIIGRDDAEINAFLSGDYCASARGKPADQPV